MNIPTITQIVEKKGSNINSTDDLSEGTNNLYYTNARIDSKLSKPRFPQKGGWTEVFDNSLMATSTTGNSRESKFFAAFVVSNPTASLTHVYETLSNNDVYGAAIVSFFASSSSQGGVSYQTATNFSKSFWHNFYLKARVRTASLATNGQLVIGLCTPTLSIPPTMGAFFHFQKGVNSDRIRCICANGTSTIINLGVGYDIESSFYRTFEIHLSYTNAKFYIDGTLVATIATNLDFSAVPFTVYMSKNSTSATGLFNFRCGLLSYYYEQV